MTTVVLTPDQTVLFEALYAAGTPYRAALAQAQLPGGSNGVSVVDGTAQVANSTAIEPVPGVGGQPTAIILRTDDGTRVKVTVHNDLSIHAAHLGGNDGPATPAPGVGTLNPFGGNHIVWNWVSNVDELYTVQGLADGVPVGDPFGPYVIADISSASLGITLELGTVYAITVTAQRNNLTADGTSPDYTYSG